MLPSASISEVCCSFGLKANFSSLIACRAAGVDFLFDQVAAIVNVHRRVAVRINGQRLVAGQVKSPALHAGGRHPKNNRKLLYTKAIQLCSNQEKLSAGRPALPSSP